MLTEIIIKAAYDPEKLERELMRLKKADLVYIIISEAKKYLTPNKG